MNTRQAVLIGILGFGSFGTPFVSEAQPTIEEFRFDPPRLCFRDTFRWWFSYRGVPGGAAAVKTFELHAGMGPTSNRCARS